MSSVSGFTQMTSELPTSFNDSSEDKTSGVDKSTQQVNLLAQDDDESTKTQTLIDGSGSTSVTGGSDKLNTD